MTEQNRGRPFQLQETFHVNFLQQNLVDISLQCWTAASCKNVRNNQSEYYML